MTTQNPVTPIIRANISTLLQWQRAALAAIAGGSELSEVFDHIALSLQGAASSALYVVILVRDQRRLRLCNNASSGLPEAYRHALDDMRGDEPWAAAADSDRTVTSADIATDPLWEELRDAARTSGLRTCWSLPIRLADGSSAGVLAVHAGEPLRPVQSDIDALTVVAQTAGLVMDRHASAQHARAAEARSRQIFNSATDFAIISTDLDGVVTGWNEGAHQVLGWTEEEMCGQRVHRIFTPEDVTAGHPETEMRRALTHGMSPDERWHMRKSGERFWASGTLTPLKTDDGKVAGFVKILRDRTEQRRANVRLTALASSLEDEVAERTRERDRIWRNSLDLLLVIGSDGILHAINPACTVALGYTSDELTGQHFGPFVHPDDINATIDAVERAAHGPLEHFEVRLRHKDGTYRWFAWRAAPENGMIYANGRDITVEKRQAEQLLMTSQARLQLALAAGQMGAWEWNLRTGTISWLHGADRVHGAVPTDQPIVHSIDDYMRHVHPEDHDHLRSLMTKAATEGRSQRGEYRIIWPDGSVHWIEVNGDMFHDETGKPLYMVGVSVDITRRKRTEQDLKFLARASVELAGLIDPQSTLDRLAYLAVPSFADWCAIDLLEDGVLRRVAVAHADPHKVQLAHTLHQRFPPDPNAVYGAWQVIRTGRSQFMRELDPETLRAAIKDPARIDALKELGLRSYIGVPLTTHGKTMGVVTFVGAESGRLYEQSDLELAEDLAHRAAVAMENASLYRALRNSDHAKDVFLATLAHELRNPLAAIVNGLGILSLAAGDRERVEQYTRLMERQAGHLTRLVDDLMDISRITTGKIELKKEASSLAGILGNAIETSRQDIEARHHQLSVTLTGESTPIIADPVRLAQVFANLLTNAAKYTHPGGRIHVSLDSTADEYTVRVKDTGVGIPRAMLTNVFKIFTQVSHPLERSQGGLGIGLSLVEGLVTLHGGRVEAFSEGEGKGSEFVVHLPRLREEAGRMEAEAKAAAAQHSEQATGRRILVVDDNVDAALTVAEILRMLGCNVQVVHDGLAAVQAVAEIRPDIVLLDIGLPGIDGYEAARRIRLQEAGSSPARLIALTGWGQEADKQRAYQAGFDQHWVKPVGLDELKKIAGST
jgi:PAS domain S-box-containing protein